MTDMFLGLTEIFTHWSSRVLKCRGSSHRSHASCLEHLGWEGWEGRASEVSFRTPITVSSITVIIVVVKQPVFQNVWAASGKKIDNELAVKLQPY